MRRAWHIESHIEVLSISQSIQYVVVVAVATFLGDQLLVVSIHEMRLGVCVYPKECSFRASDRQDRTDNACSCCQNKSILHSRLGCP